MAQRLQANAKGGEVLISHSVYECIADRVSVEPLEPLQVKGRVAPVQAYRVSGLKKQAKKNIPLVGIV